MDKRNFKDVKDYSIVIFEIMEGSSDVFYLVDKKSVAIYEYGLNCKPKDITRQCYKSYKEWQNGCNNPKIGYSLFKLVVSDDSELHHLIIIQETDSPKEITSKLHAMRLEQAHKVVRLLERFGPNKFPDECWYGSKSNFMNC